MKPAPPGWPRISSSIYYEDAKGAIDWLCKAFGFEVQLLVEGEGGTVEHSELVYGDGLIMVGSVARSKEEKYPWRRAPGAVGGANTQNLFAYVDDVVAHYERAKAAGAKIDSELSVSDYGEEYWTDKTYGCEDPGGHHWWFSQRMKTKGRDA